MADIPPQSGEECYANSGECQQAHFNAVEEIRRTEQTVASACAQMGGCGNNPCTLGFCRQTSCTPGTKTGNIRGGGGDGGGFSSLMNSLQQQAVKRQQLHDQELQRQIKQSQGVAISGLHQSNQNTQVFKQSTAGLRNKLHSLDEGDPDAEEALPRHDPGAKAGAPAFTARPVSGPRIGSGTPSLAISAEKTGPAPKLIVDVPKIEPTSSKPRVEVKAEPIEEKNEAQDVAIEETGKAILSIGGEYMPDVFDQAKAANDLAQGKTGAYIGQQVSFVLGKGLDAIAGNGTGIILPIIKASGQNEREWRRIELENKYAAQGCPKPCPDIKARAKADAEKQWEEEKNSITIPGTSIKMPTIRGAVNSPFLNEILDEAYGK